MRYLVEAPEAVIVFPSEGDQDSVEVFADSDWAGCKLTRRSTSGGVLRFGNAVVKSWSSTQAVIALSSGEAEYHAMVKAACEAMGIRALLADMGVAVNMRIRMEVDSSAAKSMASRTGVGKVRHLDVRLLWLQDACRRGDVEIVKIPGTANPSHVLTKPAGLGHVAPLCRAVGVWVATKAKGLGRGGA